MRLRDHATFTSRISLASASVKYVGTFLSDTHSTYLDIDRTGSFRGPRDLVACD